MNLTRRLSTIAIMLLAVWSAVQAQTMPNRLITSMRPSPSDECRCLMFDHWGEMWIGTSSGLKLWDGYEMRTFRSSALSPGMLPNNTVLSMAEDHDGCIWVGTRNGLARLNLKKRDFASYYLKGNANRIIYSLFTSSDGTLWIGTDGGLTRYNATTDNFETFTYKNATLISPEGRKMDRWWFSVKAMAEDRHGNLYVGTWENGLMCFNPKTRQFRQYPKMNDMNSAFSLLIDSKGRLWVGTFGYGLQMLPHPDRIKDAQVVTFKSNMPGFDTFYKLVEDPVTHCIWGATREGICIVDPATGKRETYTHADNNVLGLCCDLAADGMGNIWTSTIYGRVLQFSTLPALFSFLPLHIANTTITQGSVCSIYSDDGVWFWLGVNPYGLVLYNRNTGETLYNTDIPGFEPLAGSGLSTRITSIVRRFDGSLWFATNSYGIMIKESKAPARGVYSGACNWLKDNYVNILYESNDKRMWVGQRSSLSFVEPDGTGHVVRMSDGMTDFSNCDVRGITEDADGNIWVATENVGILRLAGKTIGRMNVRRYCPANGKYAVDDAVKCFADSHRRLWAISRSGGLFRYDRKNDAFLPVNREWGIDGDKVFSISEDKNGALWLTAEGSVVRVVAADGKMPKITHFTGEDGLDNAVFYPNACCRHGEEIFLGADNGIIAFAPAEIPQGNDVVKRNLIVTDIVVDGVSYSQLDSALRVSISPDAPRYTRMIVMPNNIDRLSVTFSLLTYSSHKRTRYAYMLEGYDEEWRFTDDNHRMVSVENIPPGSYKLHIKACDNYGRWTELPYSIIIKRLPPWYATWWAFMIYLFVALLAVYIAQRSYKNYIKTKNRLQMAVVFTNITHELLTPLTVISATVDMLRRKSPDNEEQYGIMQSNINRLTRLLRQILEVRKSQAGQLRLKVCRQNIADFIEQACCNVGPMAKAHSQEINFSCSAAARKPVWFDGDKMDKIIYNLLSNAVKYNKEGGTVSVGLAVKDKKIVMTVEDQGIGISKEKMKHLYSRFLDGDYRRMNTMGTGIGLSLTRDLVELHHGKIECRSKVGEGTLFTVTLPADRASYSTDEIDDTEQTTLNILAEKAEENIVENRHDNDETDETGERYSILVVEDNEELLHLMKQLLARHYCVHTAKNGVQAMNVIQKENLDMVVSDVMMPQMDGIELTRRIKKSDDYAHLPVLLLTAKTREEDVDKGYETGADLYMTKPFRLDDLLVRVQSVMENRERVRLRFCRQTDFVVGEQHYSNPDEAFVQRAIECVKAHIGDADYDRDTFASDMMVSSSTLYNRLRALTGQNVTGFITSIRLKEACRILRGRPDITVTELATMVGFNTPKYFSRCFKKEFGMSIKEYLS